ncbi:MAG TPA: hypothetical protein VJX74_02055 [Blastocatellia bacterium]|nr:hypothetical protein [Blastocatellia bacterium]
MASIKRKMKRAAAGVSGPPVEQQAKAAIKRYVTGTKSAVAALAKELKGVVSVEDLKERPQLVKHFTQCRSQFAAVPEMLDELEKLQQWIDTSEEAASLREFRALFESGAFEVE